MVFHGLSIHGRCAPRMTKTTTGLQTSLWNDNLINKTFKSHLVRSFSQVSWLFQLQNRQRHWNCPLLGTLGQNFASSHCTLLKLQQHCMTKKLFFLCLTLDSQQQQFKITPVTKKSINKWQKQHVLLAYCSVTIWNLTKTWQISVISWNL